MLSAKNQTEPDSGLSMQHSQSAIVNTSPQRSAPHSSS